MARKPEPAKTATVAIARVLRGLGLKQGEDFRVGKVDNKWGTGTRVNVITRHAQQVIADNANLIENASEEQGFPFIVSVNAAGDRLWTGVADYGKRIRLGADGRTVTTGHDATGQSHAALVAEWPSGTRVCGPDTAGVVRTGTVYGGDHAVVRKHGHPNDGRSYVGVTWDPIPGVLAIPRNRPFTDLLTRI